MNPRVIQQIKPLFRQSVTNGKIDILANRAAYSDYVVESALVRGDHKSPNPFSYECVERKSRWLASHKSSMIRMGTSNTHTIEGPLANLGFFDPGDVHGVAVYNAAVSDLNENLRGGLDLSVDLAESAQTFALLKNVHKAERWFSGIGAKQWASRWLEYKLGWLPLLGSIYGSVEELVALAEFKSVAKGSSVISDRLQGSRIVKNNVDLTGTSTYALNDFAISHDVAYQQGCKIKVRIWPDSTYLLSRWTSLNPFSVAWELVPCSFVVDWFVDVGSYLRDMETAFLYHARFRDGFVTRWRKYDSRENFKFSNPNSNYPFTRITSLESRSESRYVTAQRQLLYAYPMPLLPTIKAGLHGQRVLTAAALIAQRVQPKSFRKIAPTLVKAL